MYTLGLKFLILNIVHGNIYELLCFNGTIGITLSIIIQIIMSFCNCPKTDKLNLDYCDDDGKFRTIIYNLKSFSKFGGFTSFAIIILNFFENIYIFLLIYYFSLNHFAAIFTIPTYFTFIIGDWKLGLKISYLIGGIIIIYIYDFSI